LRRIEQEADGRAGSVIAAVLDIALAPAPLTSGALARRNRLSRRHFEPVLQALVHHGILRGIRGPHGGYELARAPASISAQDILRAARSVVRPGRTQGGRRGLAVRVVLPMLAQADRAHAEALRRISLAKLMRAAVALQGKRAK
jgi:Rrf2 family protein